MPGSTKRMQGGSHPDKAIAAVRHREVGWATSFGTIQSISLAAFVDPLYQLHIENKDLFALVQAACTVLPSQGKSA